MTQKTASDGGVVDLGEIICSLQTRLREVEAENERLMSAGLAAPWKNRIAQLEVELEAVRKERDELRTNLDALSGGK